ncbi:DUF805 domain-containing protein [Neobacillus rhizosphaerae]|uniref:DUF805 domain-containing protein n=1 Tax=Neobacillus rhizosphaerae TaxID=2880965 RepID=UPI003D2DBC65
MQWFLKAFQNYAVFNGRARRKEYWFFALFMGIIGIVLTVLLEVSDSWAVIIIALIFCLAMIIPSIAVTVRRLHDIGRSGWWYLLSLVPIGNIVILIFTLLDSQPETNQWGPNPKEKSL